MRIPIGIAALVVMSTLSAASVNDENEPRPNILFMIADDLGWDDICANQRLLGEPCDIHTPEIDKLAGRGVRLMRHYTEPWCLPSRSSLLTGLSPARMAVNFVSMDVKETTLLFGQGPRSTKDTPFLGLATHLRDAGYFTAWVGKWHSVGRPDKFGFQHCFGSIFGAINDFYRPSLIRFSSFDSNKLKEGPKPLQGYATKLEADEVVALINSDAWSPKERPFFIYLAFHAPRKYFSK